MDRRSALIVKARSELRDPRALLLTASTAGALLFLGASPDVVLEAAAAIIGTKLLAGAVPTLFMRRRLPREGDAAQWLGRAELAVRSLRTLARDATSGPLAVRCRSVGDRAAVTLDAMRRLALQDTTVARLLDSLPGITSTQEIAMLRAELADATRPEARADIERSLVAIRTQQSARADLAASRRALLTRMRTVALGLEGLVARLAGLLAIAATGADMPDDRVAELELELDALRSGLQETETIGHMQLEQLTAAGALEEGR